MKRFYYTVLIILVISIPAFSMGGAPAPKDSTQAPPATSGNREQDLNKARADLKDAKSELERVEKYIWVLDGRINEARKTGNVKKFVQLKEIEQQTIERSELLKGVIERLKNTYPELKASEAIETVKEKVTIPESQVKTEVPQQTSTAQGSDSIIIHEVQVGDTLMSIARKYYGNASMYKEIMRINNLTDPNLRQGMKLKIDLRLKKTSVPAVPEVSEPAL